MSKAILDEQNKRKETLMNDERREYIRDRLYQETGEPESQAWRDELTPEEMEYVERLDGRYATGIAAMCAAILVREKVRERYRPEEIAKLEAMNKNEIDFEGRMEAEAYNYRAETVERGRKQSQLENYRKISQMTSDVAALWGNIRA